MTLPISWSRPNPIVERTETSITINHRPLMINYPGTLLASNFLRDFFLLSIDSHDGPVRLFLVDDNTCNTFGGRMIAIEGSHEDLRAIAMRVETIRKNLFNIAPVTYIHSYDLYPNFFIIGHNGANYVFNGEEFVKSSLQPIIEGSIMSYAYGFTTVCYDLLSGSGSWMTNNEVTSPANLIGCHFTNFSNL